MKFVLPAFLKVALAFFGAKSVIKPTKIINAPNNNTVHFDIVVIIIFVNVTQCLCKCIPRLWERLFRFYPQVSQIIK